MKCDDAIGLSPLYLSGELEGTRLEELKLHLQACTRCSAELEQMAETDARLRDALQAEDVDPSPVEARVRAAIADRRRRWIRTGIGVAAALAVFAVGLWSMRSPAPDPACLAAARDHHREVVEGQQRNWQTDSGAMQALAAREGIDGGLLAKLAPAELHLEKAKRCRLEGNPYLHLVYSDGARRVSVFLRAEAGPRSGVWTGDAGAERVAWFHGTQIRGIVVDAGAEAGRVAQAAQAVL
jgi:anti-sigma factor RsiW